MFLVRLPIGKAIAQDLAGRRAIDIDITKELRLAIRRPDPNRFRIRPLGLPSGVQIFAMTFERTPAISRLQFAFARRVAFRARIRGT